MDKVTRIGVSLEPKLLEAFDRLIEKEGYGNRSEAIRDVLRKHLMDVGKEDVKGEMVGTITFIYDHHRYDVTNRLIELQHASPL
ncbi:MAG: ribbon-helix-helix protein, CopG family, partial [Thermoplasmata archaeon]|nr:ribbon-helix-helix protein, CopG family [Thermoplasmata archaeon]